MKRNRARTLALAAFLVVVVGSLYFRVTRLPPGLYPSSDTIESDSASSYQDFERTKSQPEPHVSNDVDSDETELAASEAARLQAEKKLDDILRPTEEDILSATVKAEVGQDEVLVTGGYKDASGLSYFAMVQPSSQNLSDGRAAILLKARQFALSDEAVAELGLSDLSTNAGNTLQHGEIWSAEGYQHFLDMVKSHAEVQTLVSPNVTTLPGMGAEIWVGEHLMSITPDLSGDNSGYDIEFRMEQPRVSGANP